MLLKWIKLTRDSLFGEKIVPIIVNIRLLLGFRTAVAKTCLARFALSSRPTVSKRALECLIVLYCMAVCTTIMYFSYLRIEPILQDSFGLRKLLILEVTKMIAFALQFMQSLIYMDAYFHDFVSTIKLIDENNFSPKLCDKWITNFVFYFCLIFIVLTRLLLYCASDMDTFLISIVTILIYVIMSCAWYKILIFEMLWRRMRFQRITLEEDLSDSEWLSDEAKIKRIRAFGLAYLQLLDALSATGHALKFSILAELVMHFYQSFSFVHLILIEAPATVVQFVICLEWIQSIILTMAPAVLAECAASEVDGARVVLARQMLWAEGGALAAAEDALLCLELRPCRYSLWRAAALDARLPLRLAALCATHVIVFVQYIKPTA